MINKRLYIVLSWLPVFICMVIIFKLSAQPAYASNNTSQGIVKYTVETGIKIAKANVPEPRKLQLVESINSIAREYMHGVVFLLLGLSAANAAIRSGLKGIPAPLVALAMCLLYATTDEIHQLYVPGRAYEISDLLMDATGSILGIIFATFLLRKIWHPYRQN